MNFQKNFMLRGVRLMKELNFRLNELYSEVLINYLNVASLTLESDNIVPVKFLNKIDKSLFKDLLKKQWKQCKKIKKFEIRHKRRQKYKEKLKFIFNKKILKKDKLCYTFLVKNDNENTVN